MKLAKDQDGELRYSAILSDGTELDSRSISELGKEASDKITLAYEDGVVTDEVRDLVVNAAAKQAEDHHNRKLTAPIAVGALFATMESKVDKRCITFICMSWVVPDRGRGVNFGLKPLSACLRA